MHLKFLSSAVAIAAVGIISTASSARASFQLRITDTTPGCSGTCSVTVTDDSTGDLDNPIPGDIHVVQSFPDFTLVTSTGTSKPVLAQSSLSLASIAVTATNPNASVRLELSDTGFMVSGPSLVQQLSDTALTHATVTSTGYASNSNTDFAESGAGTFSTGPAMLTTAPAGTSSSGSSAGLVVPFSLTEVVNIAFSGANPNESANVTAVLTVVPEPASVALLGGALLALGTAVRRRVRKA